MTETKTDQQAVLPLTVNMKSFKINIFLIQYLLWASYTTHGTQDNVSK